MMTMANSTWAAIAYRGAPSWDLRNLGKRPSSAILAYTRGAAMTMLDTDVRRARAMITRTNNDTGLPPSHSAAIAATSGIPAILVGGGA